VDTRTHTTTRYLRLDDVVERYGGAFSEWTIRDKARRGLIPHLKHPGSKLVLFRADWLDAWDEGSPLERRDIRTRGVGVGRVVRPVGLSKT
jgi:hypothetical protein